MSVQPTATERNELRDRYIDLLIKSLKNSIYGESPLEGWLRALWLRVKHPYLTRRTIPRWPLRAHTMIPVDRLRNLRELVERTLEENIPGSYIETGVWRGGACILMRAILKAHGVTDRKVYCADSFEGLPPPSAAYAADKRDRLYRFTQLAVSQEEVEDNFRAYDLLDDQVVFVKGFFRDTLGKLNAERFALLRLDGDMYESTMDALTALYDRLSPGGFIIVDDYGALSACKKAVHDFLDARQLSPQITAVDKACVWWRKA